VDVRSWGAAAITTSFGDIEGVSSEIVNHNTEKLTPLKAYPLNICALVIEVDSFVKVGTICKPSPSTKLFLLSSVVQSKEPVPNPLRSYRGLDQNDI
jgi:hypothetical protein